MKTCPRCGVEHSKSGTYCSRRCANVRERSEETKNKISTSLTGKPSKLKGRQLSPRTDEVKKKISESQKGKPSKNKGIKLSFRSQQHKDKLSEIAIKNGFGGHTSKVKLDFVKNDGTMVYLQSSYEIEFAKILEKLNVVWSRPNPLLWVDDVGKTHRYYPDFKVGDIFIDTKNDYLAVKDLPKINAVREQNGVDIRIVKKENITEEFVRSLV